MTVCLKMADVLTATESISETRVQIHVESTSHAYLTAGAVSDAVYLTALTLYCVVIGYVSRPR